MPNSTSAFTTEAILPFARANANMFLFSTLAFLKERNIPITEWTSFLTEHLAPRWETRRHYTARDIATLIAMNLASGGAELVRLDGDDHNAEVELTWDVQPYIDSFQPLTREDFTHMLRFYGDIIEPMGYTYHCNWDNPTIKIVLSQQGNVSASSED